jgi:Tol biopolymer transport system component
MPVLLAFLTACGTEPDLKLAAFDGTTSDAVPVTVLNAAGAAGSAPSIAYVSMSPGTMPDATAATIRNARTGESVQAVVDSGGFDPVAVPAETGDTLEEAIRLADGTIHLAKSIVPARRRPRVVRTSPARGRTDVAINASVVVVFSEPISSGTRDTAHIRLRAGSEVIDGEVRLVAGSEVTVEFVPAAPLAPGTAFELVLSEAIADLSGDPIEGELTIPFRTVADGPPPPPPLPAVTQVITFSRGGDILVMHADGRGVLPVTNGPGDDLHPVWSPDGTRIAFTRYLPDFEFHTQSAIHVVNADGTGLRRLSPEGVTTDRQASWSSDGTRLAFSSGSTPDDRGVYIMNADGTGRVRLTDQHTWVLYPIWSPDGTRVLFSAWDDVALRLRLWVKTLGGGIATQVPLANEGGAVYSVAWSSDASRIVASVLTCTELVPIDGVMLCNQVEGPYLTAADVDGANAVRLSDMRLLPELWFPPPEWSPDGSAVLLTQAACDLEMNVWPCDEPTRILSLRLADGVITPLAEGSDPDWRR